MAGLSDLISLLTVIISGKREQGGRVDRGRRTDLQTDQATMVHDLNCHLDFIKDKRGGEGDGHANEGMNERRGERRQACLFLLVQLQHANKWPCRGKCA